MSGLEHAEQLAMLNVPAPQREALAAELAALAELVRHLPAPRGASAADAPLQMPLRADEPAAPLSQAEALQNAADTQDGFFVVKTSKEG